MDEQLRINGYSEELEFFPDYFIGNVKEVFILAIEGPLYAVWDGKASNPDKNLAESWYSLNMVRNGTDKNALGIFLFIWSGKNMKNDVLSEVNLFIRHGAPTGYILVPYNTVHLSHNIYRVHNARWCWRRGPW